MLEENSKILTYNGEFKKIKDLSLSDTLIGKDSEPRTITSIFNFQSHLYRITRTDGTSFIVGDTFNISLIYSNSEKRYGFNQYEETFININEYVNKSNKYKSLFRTFSVPVEFKHNSTKFDPYLIGLWLGDGSKHASCITNADKEVTDYLIKFAEKEDYKVYDITPNEKCNSWRISKPHGVNEFLQEVRTFVNNEVDERFINKNYLINSTINRLSLLAGILDADGYLTNNCYDIVIKDNLFADDFEFLCRSLGFKVFRTKKISRISSLNFEGVYNRFTISGETFKIPCKIERRKAGERFQIKAALNQGFKITPLNKIGNCVKIVVKDDKEFIFDKFTLTK